MPRLVNRGIYTGYLQEQECNNNDDSAERAGGPVAESLHGLDFEHRNDHPEHDFKNVQDHIGQRTLPLAEAIHVLGQELIPEDDDGLGSHCDGHDLRTRIDGAGDIDVRACQGYGDYDEK